MTFFIGCLVLVAAFVYAVWGENRAAKPPVRTGVTHDYRTQCWGHALHTVGTGGKWNLAGFGPFLGRIQIGDWIAVNLTRGGEGRYLVLDIRYMRDPADQWFADVMNDHEPIHEPIKDPR